MRGTQVTGGRRRAVNRPGGPRKADHRTGPPALLLSCLVVLGTGGCMLPRWPVEDVLTSPFGLRWDGILPDLHGGVDIRAAEGTPVRTMAAGRVRYAGWMDGYGNVVWVDHSGGVTSAYAHLSDIDVTAGSAVRSGELLGLSGSTGLVDGPHLHFEVWKAGRRVDPVSFMGGRPAAAGSR
ncbi:MAG: M23 family metallopeptidase [Gammaproteobacteria bacterium]|nr:M23 family metallopeptidase [Gammaproteobacteria bacterium]MDE0248042.1 M23 family metallopeptidase [Gammaproteobacteria bacterium]